MRILLLGLLLGACACSQTKQGGADKDKTAVADRKVDGVEGRRIDIEVTKSGYKPGSVTMKAQEQVTLVFTRTEETACGAAVRIPSINVEKQLPLNEPVAIAFKADKAGDVEFTCGMDMWRGKLVVTQN